MKVKVKCLECFTTWREEKIWHGQSEICVKCIKKRDLRQNCTRHGGRDGMNCTACSLEDRF